MHAANRPEKDAARDAVLNLLGVDRFDSLSILTFPASDWRFERALLSHRGEPELTGPRATRIVSLERDVAIYRAACHNMPRGKNANQKKAKNKRRGDVRLLSVPSFASAAIGSVKIAAFLCATFEDYAGKASTNADRGLTDRGSAIFDAAWLDFNGQLTLPRLEAIEGFWTRQLRSVLVVTLLDLNMSDRLRAWARDAGGLAHLLASRLPGSEIASVHRYGDGAPMVQIVLRRAWGQPRLVSLARVAAVTP